MIYFIIRNLWGRGGTEKFARILAKKISQRNKRNIRVKILTTRKSFKDKKHYFSNNISLVSFYIPQIRLIGTLYYYLLLSIYLFFHQFEYQIIQVFFLKHSAFVSAIIGKFLKKRIICRLAGAGEYGDISAIKKIPFYPFFLKIFKNIDAFIVLSKKIEEELINCNFSKDKIYFIPNGVDIEKFKMPEDKKALKEKYGFANKKIITFVGRLSDEKGLEFLMEAFKNLNIQGKYLLILGEGHLKEKLINYTQNPGISEKVSFLGFCEDVSDYLKISDLFVLPSISEGMSNALLEAMASGLPVVATKVSGNVDLIEDSINGFLVDPANSQQLTIAMERILKDERLVQKMGEANRKKIEKYYSMEKVVSSYIAIYEELISKKPDFNIQRIYN